MGATQGASTGGKVMNGLGHAAALAPVAAGSFKATSQQPGFKPQSTVKMSSSPGELNGVIARVLRAKFASGPAWHRPVNALSYAAFAAPYLSNKIHDNKPLTTALNAAGLVGLGATNADSIRHGDPIAGYDLAGLGMMGAGMIHSALRPSPTPGAGH